MNTSISPNIPPLPDDDGKPGNCYCEICGVLVYRDGIRVDAYAGICSGCERELCGTCAEWGDEGECVTCREFPYSHCHYCGAAFTEELRGGYKITHCPWCGHEIDQDNIAKDPLRQTILQ